MHGLDTIIAINERASRRCARCEKRHCEYPGSEVLVKDRILPADLPEGVQPDRIPLCGSCVSALVAEGVEVYDARK